MTIGDRLREERERLGLSQTAMAALVQASKGSQINWERNASSPNAADLAVLAQAGLDVLYVVTGSRDFVAAPALKPDEAVLLEAYRAAVPVVRKAALGALLGGALPSVVVHGAVGQRIEGGASIRGQTINVGTSKKRR